MWFWILIRAIAGFFDARAYRKRKKDEENADDSYWDARQYFGDEN